MFAAMAIDYVLAVECEPQRALGTERLVQLNRTRILARSMLAHMREDGDARDPRDIEIQLTMRNPGGDSARGVTLADLLAEAAPLDDVKSACASCPAGFTHDFGCHRRIRYPVPERVEEWLMRRLPTSLATTAGIFLVRALGDFGWDGAPTAKLRAAGTTYFESRVPYGARWQGDDGVIELSADQLFQMMFLVGNLEPAHCLMLALFTGVIPHDVPIAELKDDRARLLASVHVATEPDPEIEQLAAFLRMLAVAARLDTKIVVDG